MTKSEKLQYEKINEIISVVRLSSLLFVGISYFQHFFSYRENFFNIVYNYYSTLTMGIIILLLSLIYTIWSFSKLKKLNAKHKNMMQFVENFIFILLFLSSILISGGYKSTYKFLFLFIIITNVIQYGMNRGMLIACISSFIILAIDVIGLYGAEVNSYLENDFTLAGIFILTAWILGFYVRIENEQIQQLERLANEDGLTGVYNHRFFHNALKQTIEACKYNDEPVSLIFMDIDYFKHYNDLYGHQKGDEILHNIGLILKKSVRENDIVARYGGEEFSIILPNTLEEDAIAVAEKIRSNVENTYFDGDENQPNGKLTVSLGVSIYPYKAKNEVDLIKSADDALYRAKFFNKNRVESYSSILDELKNDIEEEHIDLVTSIKTLISVINAKDRYTYGHTERVVIYSRMLADKLGLSKNEKKKLIYGAYMHDIGKINISEKILNKKMPLTDEEREILKQHPRSGAEIIKPVESLRDVIPLILHHHERYDGNGYPSNLKGEDIPFLARALTVVDSFDAMTSNRPYNRRKGYIEAINELRKCSGTQFDPTIVEAFIDAIYESKYVVRL